MERELRDGQGVEAEVPPEREGGSAPSWLETAPELLAPIDPDAPVSGHLIGQAPPSAPPGPAPEQDWGVARPLIHPLLRPAGTVGLTAADVTEWAREGVTGKTHAQPLRADGPCGLAVVFAIPATGFDVLVNGEHILAWGVGAADVEAAAMATLAAWSQGAPWTDEVSGERRLLSSDTGDGWDAARILLPEVRAHLARELATGRVLVGLPERHLLLAGPLVPGDDEFAVLFRDFVVEHSGGADEPIDRRVFELRGAELIEFVD